MTLNDQHNNTQYNDSQHNETKHNSKIATLSITFMFAKVQPFLQLCWEHADCYAGYRGALTITRNEYHLVTPPPPFLFFKIIFLLKSIKSIFLSYKPFYNSN
jgi:hypothetical protein